MKTAARQFQNKQVLVLGLAKSGVSTAELLTRLGAKVIVSEKKPREACTGVEKLEAMGMEVVCSGHPLSLLERDLYLLVRNPGIPYDLPFLQEAGRRHIPVVTEVELGYLITEAPIIGITGSNGKTTTTTLIYEMLKGGEKDPLIAGNIGNVFCEVAEKARPDQWLVTELSSFQLLGTQYFQPQIGLILNIYEAHLDYHHTKEHYLASKAKLLANQRENQLSILNADQKEIRELAECSSAAIAWFSMEQEVSRGCYIEDASLIYKDKFGQKHVIIHTDELKLPGKHNLQNMLAAVCASIEAGASQSSVAKVLRTFEGVEHRLQFVRERDGVRYYNDSKATNVLATQKALQAFEDGSVLLLAGGLDRGTSYDGLIKDLSANVKAVIAFGQVSGKLVQVARKAGVQHIVRVHTVLEGVQVAHEIAGPGDTVLLSPAAASWDQFRSFEERGDMFIKSVHML